MYRCEAFNGSSCARRCTGHLPSCRQRGHGESRSSTTQSQLVTTPMAQRQRHATVSARRPVWHAHDRGSIVSRIYGAKESFLCDARALLSGAIGLRLRGLKPSRSRTISGFPIQQTPVIAAAFKERPHPGASFSGVTYGTLVFTSVLSVGCANLSAHTQLGEWGSTKSLLLSRRCVTEQGQARPRRNASDLPPYDDDSASPT